MLLMWLNLTAGLVAGLVYALWAHKWWTRGQRLLTALHVGAAVVAIALGVAYGVLIADPRLVSVFGPALLRPLVAAMLLLPAIARWIELLREERREAVDRQVRAALRGQVGPGA